MRIGEAGDFDTLVEIALPRTVITFNPIQYALSALLRVPLRALSRFNPRPSAFQSVFFQVEFGYSIARQGQVGYT